MTVLAVTVLHVVEVALEVATVMDEDEEGGLSIEARILKAISHLVVVKISEAEDEADINNEVISLNISAITVINMVISFMSVERKRWKKEVILQQKKKTKILAVQCSSLTKETRKTRRLFGILNQGPVIT